MLITLHFSYEFVNNIVFVFGVGHLQHSEIDFFLKNATTDSPA